MACPLRRPNQHREFALDLFNRSLYQSHQDLHYYPTRNVVTIFLEQLFISTFHDSSGQFVGIDKTVGDGVITREDIVRTIAVLIAHEAGHTLGLRHLAFGPKHFIEVKGNPDSREPYFDTNCNRKYERNESYIDWNGNNVYDSKGIDEYRFEHWFGNSVTVSIVRYRYKFL